jgi:NAD(P)-dependent dehydrogenase (short-subunit alcohol dehydrogenase family)
MARPDSQTLPDQTGRLAIVTGSTSGIGFQTAKQLAAAGAEVILAVRNPTKGESAIKQILAAVSRAKVEQCALDLSSLSSVQDFTQRMQRVSRPIDILVNNAGIMAIPHRVVTADGFEMQLGTNFLGHFALSGQLLDLLRAAPAPRVVNLGSVAARFPGATIHWDDLQLEKGYSGMKAYGQSKLAAILFALELGRRSEAGAWGIVSAAAHPGSATTNLQVTGNQFGKTSTKRPVNATTLVMKIPGLAHSAERGALPILKAATDPTVKSGDYFGPSRNFESVGPPKPATFPRLAKHADAGHRLWVAAEQLTGVRWPETSPVYE